MASRQVKKLLQQQAQQQLLASAAKHQEDEAHEEEEEDDEDGAGAAPFNPFDLLSDEDSKASPREVAHSPPHAPHSVHRH